MGKIAVFREMMTKALNKIIKIGYKKTLLYMPDKKKFIVKA